MKNLKTIISQSYVGLLYEDGIFIKILEPGKYRFRRNLFKQIDRNVKIIDMRERSLTIKGQEILTADKVAIRVSLLVYFKVLDAVAAAHNVSSYEDRIYEDVQLAARRYLASKNLDAILTDRNEISDTVRNDVKEAAASYGVKIIRADVKDLVFPGNLREIMNKVLETERRAEGTIIEAKKDAEALKIRSLSESEDIIRRLKTEKEQVKLQAEAEKERHKIRLESDIEQAEALSKNPQLIKLKQLEVLKQLAKEGGGKFIIGLKSDEIVSLIDE